MSVANQVRWLLRSSSESERRRFLDLVVLMRSRRIEKPKAAGADVANAVQGHTLHADGTAVLCKVIGSPYCEVCGADNTLTCGNRLACPYKL